MVWYFIGVYIINRSLHGRLEIRKFSSHAEKIFHSFAALTCEEKFRTSARPWNILYIHRIKLRHKRSRQHNNIDSRINITTFFNLRDMFQRYICHLQCYIFWNRRWISIAHNVTKFITLRWQYCRRKSLELVTLSYLQGKS